MDTVLLELLLEEALRAGERLALGLPELELLWEGLRLEEALPEALGEALGSLEELQALLGEGL